VKALQENYADGFRGNGMRLALAEKAGLAKLHLDLRRGDGPAGAPWHSIPIGSWVCARISTLCAETSRP
jgi:hypothetical protein